jgi:succinylglutamate desuccinylase
MPELDPLEFYGFLSPKARSRSGYGAPWWFAFWPRARALTCVYVSPPRQLEELKMDMRYLTRNVNEGFSGGEKKRNEILQARTHARTHAHAHARTHPRTVHRSRVHFHALARLSSHSSMQTRTDASLPATSRPSAAGCA